MEFFPPCCGPNVPEPPALNSYSLSKHALLLESEIYTFILKFD